MLVAEMKKQVNERGADSLELMVWRFNTDAIGFYEKMGMTEKNRVMEIKL